MVTPTGKAAESGRNAPARVSAVWRLGEGDLGRFGRHRSAASIL